MDFIEEMKNSGVDTDNALERFIGNTAFLEKMLKKMPASVQNLEVLKYIEENDIKTATENAHTLKGMAGNLSVTFMYDAYTKITDYLRANDIASATQLLKQTLPAQEQFIAKINSFQTT